MVSAEDERHGIEGLWDVTATVRDCQTGAVIRQVRGITMFIQDGSMTQIAANLLRSSAEGTWRHTEADNFTESFWFFRYNPDGSVASTANVTHTIELSRDGTQFTSSGVVRDFGANKNLISTACATETATRLQ
jgi:hypothetical protein